MILGADHFVILVNDLNASIETYLRLGFDAQPGGDHPLVRQSQRARRDG